MTSDPASLYNAYASRDPRFDGVFYVGVTSTGIYCRPVCTATHAEGRELPLLRAAPGAAEKAAFRPCLRCRPELAPGNAPVDDAQRIAALVATRIDEGLLGRRRGAGAHRGAVRAQLAPDPPHRAAGARRLADGARADASPAARQAAADRDRRCRSSRSPSRAASRACAASTTRSASATACRRRGCAKSVDADASSRRTGRHADPAARLPAAVRLGGAARLPRARARSRASRSSMTDAYARTVRLGDARGMAARAARAGAPRAARGALAHADARAARAARPRCGSCSTCPRVPTSSRRGSADDPGLGALVAAHPGIRVPGAFDGFELAVRAILGQQITVRAATTLAGRFVAAFGDPIVTPHDGLTHLCPTPAQVAALDPSAIAALGIVAARARCLVALADALASGRLTLEPGAQARARHRAARRAAGDRRVDRAVHRDARAAVAGRLPEGGRRPAEAARRRERRGGRGAVGGVAAVAELRDAAALAERGVSRRWRRCRCAVPALPLASAKNIPPTAARVGTPNRRSTCSAWLRAV